MDASSRAGAPRGRVGPSRPPRCGIEHRRWAVTPTDDNAEFDRLETDIYDEDDAAAKEATVSEVDALELAPLSDQTTRDLIVDE